MLTRTQPKNALLRFLGAAALVAATSTSINQQTTFGARPEEPEYDLVIVNGHILDGSGSPWASGAAPTTRRRR